MGFVNLLILVQSPQHITVGIVEMYGNEAKVTRKGLIGIWEHALKVAKLVKSSNKVRF